MGEGMLHERPLLKERATPTSDSVSRGPFGLIVIPNDVVELLKSKHGVIDEAVGNDGGDW